MPKITKPKERRKKMSDDFICGYFSAISDMTGKLGILKAAFDVESFQARASQKVEKRLPRKDTVYVINLD